MTKIFKKEYDSKYIRPFEKTAFKNDFGPWEVPKPKEKVHESASAGFLVWALPKIQNYIQKHFSHGPIKLF